MKDDDIFFAWTLVLCACAVFVLVISLVSGAVGDYHFMGRHEGLEKLTEQMQHDCEMLPGVVGCDWDSDKLTYVPAED